MPTQVVGVVDERCRVSAGTGRGRGVLAVVEWVSQESAAVGRRLAMKLRAIPALV
jgi:hypothetical protein